MASGDGPFAMARCGSYGIRLIASPCLRIRRGRRVVVSPTMVWEWSHGADHRSSPGRGAGGTVPGGTGRDRGAALPGDLAAGAGADLRQGRRGAGLRAALGGGTGGPLQRVRPGGSRRPAAAQRPGRQPADRASLLTEAVLSALAKRGRTPPEDGGLWSGPKVAAWMARRLGLAKVHPQRGWEALKRIKWSVQAPRPRHARAATPEEQA